MPSDDGEQITPPDPLVAALNSVVDRYRQGSLSTFKAQCEIHAIFGRDNVPGTDEDKAGSAVVYLKQIAEIDDILSDTGDRGDVGEPIGPATNQATGPAGPAPSDLARRNASTSDHGTGLEPGNPPTLAQRMGKPARATVSLTARLSDQRASKSLSKTRPSSRLREHQTQISLTASCSETTLVKPGTSPGSTHSTLTTLSGPPNSMVQEPPLPCRIQSGRVSSPTALLASMPLTRAPFQPRSTIRLRKRLATSPSPPAARPGRRSPSPTGSSGTTCSISRSKPWSMHTHIGGPSSGPIANISAPFSGPSTPATTAPSSTSTR